MEQNSKELIEYLERKLDNSDKKLGERFDRLLGVVVTKDEFKNLEKKIDERFGKAIEIFATKEDIKDLSEKVNGLTEMVQLLVVSMDKLVKELSDLRIEYHVMSNQLTRHEKWIQMMADRIGVHLEY